MICSKIIHTSGQRHVVEVEHFGCGLVVSMRGRADLAMEAAEFLFLTLLHAGTTWYPTKAAARLAACAKPLAAWRVVEVEA